MENTIKINDTEIFYESRGKGIPILIIHGWRVDHHVMSGSMENMFHGHYKRFFRIYIDLPGMGKSQVNNNVKTADDVLDILIKFIDSIIPGRKFLLVCDSWGGLLAKGLVIHKANDILGICFLCTISISGKKNISVPAKTVLVRDNAYINTLSKPEKDTFCGISVIQTKKNWLKFKKDVYPGLITYNEEYLKKTLNAFYSNEKNNVDIFFDKPVLSVSGKQDHVAGYEDQMEYFMKFPRATAAVLDAAGHCLQIEQEKMFHALLADWLDRVRTDMNNRS